MAVAVLAVAAAVALYVVFRGRTAPDVTVAETAPPVRQVETPPQPLGAEPQPVAVPPLGESDPVVRELVRQLSSHPRVAAWLATEGLIRNFTVVVENVADGMTPAGHLRAMRPPEAFAVAERGEDLTLDPRAYRRYDSFADAFRSIDVAGSARVYATLKPRIEEAHRELGSPDPSFDRTLERAIVHLLRTPIIGETPRVEPQGIGYRFEDANLESLTAAQKHLLRMGPRNVRIVQLKLRDIAAALGIPAERLPPQAK
jgi:hypothetical protein